MVECGAERYPARGAWYPSRGACYQARGAWYPRVGYPGGGAAGGGGGVACSHGVWMSVVGSANWPLAKYSVTPVESMCDTVVPVGPYLGVFRRGRGGGGIQGPGLAAP